MGWLLLTKNNYNKKKTRKTATTAKNAAPANSNKWDPNKSIVRLQIVGVIALACAVAICWRYGYTTLSKQIANSYKNSKAHQVINLEGKPPWMSASITNNIKQTVAEQISSNPLSGASLHNAALAMSRIAWVKQVVQVKRAANGNIKVYALYRTPFALVEYGNGYRLISKLGVELLSKPYGKNQISKIGLPVITGVSSTPPEKAGMRWKDSDLFAGLSLINILSHQQFYNQIIGVNVSNHDARGRQRLVINTVNGGKIAWGYAPNIHQEIEPDTEVKIERLKRLAQVYKGSIDANAQHIEIYGAAIRTQSAPLKRWNVSN